ncbi:MAG: HaeII family restriction endonuclease [Microscillaceae bacterium]|nr:HaeII family restriction endonuclease [Microscillaceae bacterium]
MSLQEAKKSLDNVISKSRIHLYKPIQIAEILFRDRTQKDIDLADLQTYRNPSKKWRDTICLQFLGRTSTSSARYQDDIFNENAIPPSVLESLGRENRQKMASWKPTFTSVLQNVFRKCRVLWRIVTKMIQTLSNSMSLLPCFGQKQD